MRPSTHAPISEEKLTSTGTADVQTATIPRGTSSVLLTAETNPARFTLSQNGDPTTGIAPILQKDQQPWLLLVGAGARLQFVSTVAAPSVIQIVYLS